ncbi:MAG: class I SAM-dependent methyltransferase [Candidatus Hodarchaeota archaeon]
MTEHKYLQDPKKRFSSRVKDYIKYRPGYPQVIIDFLKEKNILKDNSVVADIGSGTGILSELFLKNGNKVYSVEPNPDMRKAAERLLGRYGNFISISGSAEKTGLKERSIDLITAGQAFHWFDIKKTKREFKRILNPDGYVVLIWNNRKKSGNNFSSDYEQLILKYGTDYKEVRKNEKNVNEFYEYNKNVFYNYQDLDYDGFKGRLLSTSYIPLEDNPSFAKMLEDLQDLFSKYQKKGTVRLEYDTEVYYGKLDYAVK